MLSMARTANPRSIRRSTMWLPMNPAPPVTTAMGFTTAASSCRLELLQAADVEIERVLHAVRQLALLERLAKIANRVLDVVLGLEAEQARDLLRVDVVRADVVG